MKRKFVDTNIFISVLARSGKKADACTRLLKGDIPLWTTELVILEIEWVLRSNYGLPKDQVVNRIRRILKIKALEIRHRKNLISALDLYERVSVDLTDCLNALLCREEGVSAVYSYDRDFDKLEFLKRVEP